MKKLINLLGEKASFLLKMKYFTTYFFWWLRSLWGIQQQTTFLLYIEINRNKFATLSEAIEEIERCNFLTCYLEVISNHNQDLVLPKITIHMHMRKLGMTTLVWLEI